MSSSDRGSTVSRRRLLGTGAKATVLGLALLGVAAAPPRGTGDLALVVERASGTVQIVDTTARQVVSRVAGLGDLSHATAVFSRDARHAFVFGRDGGLSKIDLLAGEVVARVVQAGNSIGGAISDDGTIVAVGNYAPGGVKLFATGSLAPLADIPALTAGGAMRSKVVGLVSAPGRRFVVALYDAGEIWLIDCADPAAPLVRKYPGIGRLPYDGNITSDGRFYIAGLFGEDGLALLDLWNPDAGVRRILDGYGRGEEPLPVYKMPHLAGWGRAGGLLLVPAVGRHEVLVIDTAQWREVKRIPVRGQPVFIVVRPDGRQAWVNFALPDSGTVQVIDMLTLAPMRDLQPGKAVLHMEFSPRGEQMWVSARDSGKVVVYDSRTFAILAELPSQSPSGIFMAARAHTMGR
ncbi:MAG: protein nirF [Acetobacteraceae bacterium]|nr:protein nirF [Acetobacteraceae bacterium]